MTEPRVLVFTRPLTADESSCTGPASLRHQAGGLTWAARLPRGTR